MAGCPENGYLCPWRGEHCTSNAYYEIDGRHFGDDSAESISGPASPVVRLESGGNVTNCCFSRFFLPRADGGGIWGGPTNGEFRTTVSRVSFEDCVAAVGVAGYFFNASIDQVTAGNCDSSVYPDVAGMTLYFDYDRNHLVSRCNVTNATALPDAHSVFGVGGYWARGALLCSQCLITKCDGVVDSQRPVGLLITFNDGRPDWYNLTTVQSFFVDNQGGISARDNSILHFHQCGFRKQRGRIKTSVVLYAYGCDFDAQALMGDFVTDGDCRIALVDVPEWMQVDFPECLKISASDVGITGNIVSSEGVDPIEAKVGWGASDNFGATPEEITRSVTRGSPAAFVNRRSPYAGRRIVFKLLGFAMILAL